MERNKNLIHFIVILIGMVVPFVQYIVVIELFFLLIPFAILFIATTIYLIVSFLNKNIKSQKAVFTFSILPIFLLSQLASGFIVDKLQRIRSESIIQEVQKIKAETREFPQQYDLSMGIEYKKLIDKTSFQLSYSRGFMVIEKYDSKNKEWKSYGWND